MGRDVHVDLTSTTPHNSLNMSRFVSGGTNEEPTERDEAWIAAQASLEAKRAEKAAQAQQNDGLSLYETLQKNKGDLIS